MNSDASLHSVILIKNALDGGMHSDAFGRAVNNILLTELAEVTLAQIVDGLPLSNVIDDVGYGSLHDEHPVLELHPTLCSGVLGRTRELRQQLKVDDLKLETKLLSDFRRSSPGSQMFNVRLIELAAAAIHQIAVDLFNMDEKHHKNDGLATWTPPADDSYWSFYPRGRWPTLFYHAWYDNHEQYPYGIADTVGYWAEARIFGGVILFDRRTSDSSPDVEPDSVWLHPNRLDITYRICKLLDEQKQALLLFLTSETPDLDVLPILPDAKNTVREDPEEPVQVTGIYRDPWERRARTEKDGDDRSRDVWDQIEFPTLADYNRAHDRARKQMNEFCRKSREEDHEKAEEGS